MRSLAFLTPLAARGSAGQACRAAQRLAPAKRPAVRHASRRWVACAPRPEEERARNEPPRDLAAKTGGSARGEPAADDDLEAASAVAMQEIDQLAEQWIGSNLARWEWYEHVKARRERMLRASKEKDEKFDEELQELKRTFMEIDAVFGTNMIENNKVSAAGWSTVVIIMLLYVILGYWAFELVVGWLTSLAPQGFP